MAQGSVDSDRLSSADLSTGGSVVGIRVGDQNKQEDDYDLGPLPPMWEKAFTPSGEVYFIDHNSGTSHWLDPRLARVRKHSLGECGEDELPYGWERVTDERYGSYYVDHINRRTQYENPVLQARRLRAEKLSSENPGGSQQNGSMPHEELRGDRFTVTLTKGTQGLGFTLIGAEGVPEIEGYLQIRSIVPHSPAWIDGALRPGDVLVGVGGSTTRGLSHAAVAQIFQAIPRNAPVTLHLVRGYPLSFDSEDPNTRVLSTLAVEANPEHDAVAMQHLTRALRTRFNLDSPGTPVDRDEADTPVAPHSPNQRRMMSRSFDLDELGTTNEQNQVPPRCPSADHLLSLASDSRNNNTSSMLSEPGRELVIALRRGNAGFGFTIADSHHGQRVKKVLDRSRCAGLREGDLLLEIGDTDVRHAPHHTVVQVLKECKALQETAVRIWRRAPRAQRSRSATRHQPNDAPPTNNLHRSKTPTAEQLRTTHDIHDRLNGMNTEATYAVPEHKRESLIDRRRRSSTPGGRLTVPIVTPWNDNNDRHNWQDDRWIDNSRNWSENKWENNRPNWEQNGQKWDQNDQKWDGNQQNWDQNCQKWDGNQQNWDQNGQKWDGNQQNWNQNGQKWEGNQQNWDPNGRNQPHWDQTSQKWDGNRSSWEQGSQTGQKWDQNGQKWDQNGQKWDGNMNNNGSRWDNDRWGNNNWGEVATPTGHVDINAGYWRGNASVADSSDNGGFSEDGILHSPTTAAISGMQRHQPPRRALHSPTDSGRLRSQSPSTVSANDHPLTNSPSTRLHTQSPANSNRIKSSPMRLESPSRRVQSAASRRSPNYDTDSVNTTNVYPGNYTQNVVGVGGVGVGVGGGDPAADVVVRVGVGGAGFGFRIVGGTEDGSRVAVGHVVPGGPAEGLLRPGDLLTSVDGESLIGATHARAVHAVCRAAARGHVTLGVRHNRADIQPLSPSMQLATHQNIMTPDPSHQPPPNGGYNILHPAPIYPPSAHGPIYGEQYEQQSSAPYDVTLTRSEGEGFGFVVISSANRASSSIGQLIPNSPAARSGFLRVGDIILAINRVPVAHLPHPELVSLIKHSGHCLTLTVRRPT